MKGIVNYFGVQRFGAPLSENTKGMDREMDDFKAIDEVLSGGYAHVVASVLVCTDEWIFPVRRAAWRQSSSLVTGIYLLRGDFRRALSIIAKESGAQRVQRVCEGEDPVEMYSVRMETKSSRAYIYRFDYIQRRDRKSLKANDAVEDLHGRILHFYCFRVRLRNVRIEPIGLAVSFWFWLVTPVQAEALSSKTISARL